MRATCTVTLTHHLGKKLERADWPAPIPAEVRLIAMNNQALARMENRLTLDRLQKFGAVEKSAVPDLLDPRLLFIGGHRRSMMFVGYEEIMNQRYYQGWWLEWAEQDCNSPQ